MSQPPGPLNPQQRQQLIGQIGQAVTAGLPPGWRQVRVEYRAAGRHIEADVVVTRPDGTPVPVQPPPPAVQLLGTLRTGMYQPGRGTWLAAALVFVPGGPPRTEFVIDEEPGWRRVPPPIGFADELRFFPRADQFVPEWLTKRARGDSGDRPADEYGLRQPRVYDGLDPDGRPVVNRPPLPPAERDRALDYLTKAPVVMAARSYDTDAFAPDREPAVPLNFRTDGVWVWPGSVGYYLREHAIAPDPDLMAYLRARNFVLPEVGEPARKKAVAAITGQSSTED
ncbi:hypothetical protein BAY59_22370 [Prauserella coralliicola]|nr:hypothetical protein BAY59_22370 [Prauserella coralliicola]